MGVLEVLLIAFIIMKVAGIITWSWWLVLLPLWIGIIWYTIVLIFGLSVFRRLR